MNRLTQENRRILYDRIYDDEMTDKAFAEMLGVTPQTIQYHRLKAGIRRQRGKKEVWGMGRIETIIKLQSEGKDKGNIAEHLGIKESTLSTYLTRMRKRGVYIPYFFTKK